MTKATASKDEADKDTATVQKTVAAKKPATAKKTTSTKTSATADDATPKTPVKKTTTTTKAKTRSQATEKVAAAGAKSVASADEGVKPAKKTAAKTTAKKSTAAKGADGEEAKTASSKAAAPSKTASKKTQTTAKSTTKKTTSTTKAKNTATSATAQKTPTATPAAMGEDVPSGVSSQSSAALAEVKGGEQSPVGVLEGSKSLPLEGSKAKSLPAGEPQEALSHEEHKALQENRRPALTGTTAKALAGSTSKELTSAEEAASQGKGETEPGKKKTATQKARSQKTTKTAAKATSKTVKPKTSSKSTSTKTSPTKTSAASGATVSKDEELLAQGEIAPEGVLSDAEGTPSASHEQDIKATERAQKSTQTSDVLENEAVQDAGDSAKIAEQKTQGSAPKGAAKKGTRGSAKGAQKSEKGAAKSSAQDSEKEAKTSSKDTKATSKNEPAKKNTPASRVPRRKMFVSVVPEEQIEVVITEEGQVQEYYVEMLQHQKTKGNIYKATIHNVDANLQAAFVSYGAHKNGFLQIDEVHPEYYNVPHDESSGRRYPPIQKVLKAGQELLVQVVKEPNASKGAFLTTYLSLAGRFLVLTPGREQIGVSRKVDDNEERGRLREMLEGLKPGDGLGVIVRTVSMGMNKATLKKDLQSLKTTWKKVRKLGTEETAPKLIHQEIGLATRSVRDYLTDQITEIWIDDADTAKDVETMAGNLFPKKSKLIHVHADLTSSLFERFNLQRQLDQIQSREVALPSGGRLVIDMTEALTAIDINSGRSGGKNSFEDMAFRTNMEAAKMIPLQLRLRDIGGQVVCDFIEMRDKAHWREVEKTVRASMKVDRARHDIGRISSFGLLELVRQRLGSSAISVNMEVCPHCKGSGVRRNIEWQSQQALKEIARKMRAAKEQRQASVQYEADVALVMHLLNSKRQRLNELEEQLGVTLEVTLLEQV